MENLEFWIRAYFLSRVLKQQAQKTLYCQFKFSCHGDASRGNTFLEGPIKLGIP